MTTKKNDPFKKSIFTEISNYRIVTGIVLGLFYAIVFYLFLYLLREVFRVMSVTDNYDMWILTDSEVHFYNLFFALISVIWGQSICFSFWLDRPRRMFDILDRRRITILNDQRVLNWNFLSWFVKLAVVFGIMFGLAFHAGFYTFSLYPTYNYIFILIAIVLFLQTWNTIRQTFKGKSLRWMLVSLIIVSTTSWGLSRVNIIDYKAINNSYLQYNIQHNYNLETPESGACEKLRNLSLLENIYVVESKNAKTLSNPIIVMNNQEIALKDLHSKIENLKEIYGEMFFKNVLFQLHIHNAIKMRFVNKIEGELSKCGVSRIAYAVVPVNHRYDKRYYQNYGFPTKLPTQNNGFTNPTAEKTWLQKFSNPIVVKVDEQGNYIVNDSNTKPANLKQVIQQLINQNSNYIIKLYIDDNSDFSTYFNAQSSSKEAVDELRNKYALSNFSKPFSQLDDKEVSKVVKEYPFRVFEVNLESQK